MKGKLLSVFIAFLMFAAFTRAATVIAQDFPLPWIQNTVVSNEYAIITQDNFFFENGDYFWINRHEPQNTSETPYYTSFNIPGDEIEIRYVKEIDGVKQWIIADEYENTESTTLFISTDKYHIILGVPSVYEKQDEYDTLSYSSKLEAPARITKGDGFYTIQILFPQNEEYIGEIWALQSANRLIEWDERAEAQFMSHELANGRRVSLGGYYFQAFDNYVPGGPGVLFRHPSCYTGGSFSRYSGSNAETALGYALMKLSSANQNELGFYPVPCESSWLKADFEIGPYYYDTRWNSDFAANLIDAYKAYGDPEFLENALKYAEFFLDYAERNSYQTSRGILVQDYWQAEEHKPTHTSLNHHLAELNFMLKFYELTQDGRYREMAEKMLRGIEDTVDDWQLPDGNLAYAMHYSGTANVMMDYPYLTYNDLFTTRELLKRVLSTQSKEIQRLMDGKLSWMVENGVTGYWE